MAFSSSSSCFFTSPNFNTINQQESSSSPFMRPTSSVKFASRISANFATAERTTSGNILRSTRIGNSNSLYDVLGIEMGADTIEIKAAYRKLARVLHPDVGNNDSSADEFMKVHSAYVTLSDPGKRADYDKSLFGRQMGITIRTNSSRVGYTRAAGYSGRRWETDQCW
uniref:chaperone protein dnaJ 11, chloroplastic-like n=1 Tax=Erigeron canadensis TaxID=72917 RepID=UPI001CB97B3C|nr:chaperone protein dnaJ 11, chloroplastic-like [Erigeron canadensis]